VEPEAEPEAEPAAEPAAELAVEPAAGGEGEEGDAAERDRLT
jgi:hypothetical protein